MDKQTKSKNLNKKASEGDQNLKEFTNVFVVHEGERSKGPRNK